MKTLLCLLAFLCAATVTHAAPDTRCFEMRVYYAAEGKLDALHKRFRDHTCKLFEKHGITNLGYFVPIGDNPERKLIYFLAYPSLEARNASWKAFMADPNWQKAYKASEVDGKLVAKIESAYLNATDYSPLAKAENIGSRVFELRTYTAEPGRLPNLNARFRDHTLTLFTKHGITNLPYWTPMADQKGAVNPPGADTLIYLLAHASQDAAKASFGNFGKDPGWQAARKASEEKAGGSLTIKGGVKSAFLVATDYSSVK
ncbi:MAG: NIPSNAP family protein [Verrucomicrobia bacterium]|nr:NIPSNAP family protein [Verrucomicrobiota bacterium]